jgi:hypothetical protein
MLLGERRLRLQQTCLRKLAAELVDTGWSTNKPNPLPSPNTRRTDDPWTCLGKNSGVESCLKVPKLPIFYFVAFRRRRASAFVIARPPAVVDPHVAADRPARRCAPFAHPGFVAAAHDGSWPERRIVFLMTSCRFRCEADMFGCCASTDNGAFVEGFGCRPIATMRLAPGPASESLQ